MESGVARCPCCGDDTMVNDLAKPLCDDCIGAGCEMTRDAGGELGYWECQREDAGPGAACWEYQASELPVRLSFSIKVF